MNSFKITRVSINSRIKGLLSLHHRAQIRRSWKMSEVEFERYQANAFRKIYKFACKKVPYYINRPGIYKTLAGDDRNVFDLLSLLPVITKQTVREHNEEFWPDPPLQITKYHATSGTTGTPLKLAATIWERSFGQATYDEWIQKICGKRHPRTLNLSGFLSPDSDSKDIYWEDPIFGNAFLSIYSLNQTNRREVIGFLKRMDPEIIAGYASSVYELASLLGDESADNKNNRIAVVTSEVLFPEWRKTIEENLCHRVYDYYGSQERSHGVIECKYGKRHIIPQVGVIEIVDDKGVKVKDGELGKVLVTSLMVRSMPLFRYEIGDLAYSTGFDTNCSCGLHWPTIGSIEGRSEDLVITRDGRKIGYLAFHAFKMAKGVIEAQIVQKSYDKFLCNIVLDSKENVNRPELENLVIGEMTKRLQANIEMSFNYVGEIPRGTRGKFKAVIVDFD